MILFIIPMVLLILLISYLGRQIYDKHFVTEDVEVPGLIGLFEDEASKMLYEKT